VLPTWGGSFPHTPTLPTTRNELGSGDPKTTLRNNFTSRHLTNSSLIFLLLILQGHRSVEHNAVPMSLDALEDQDNGTSYALMYKSQVLPQHILLHFLHLWCILALPIGFSAQSNQKLSQLRLTSDARIQRVAIIGSL
jgi:hypothetical protein